MEATYNPVDANYADPTKPLSALCSRWRGVINAARAHKDKEFGKTAEEARNYFDGPPNFFWKQVADQAASQQNEGFLAGTSMLPQFKFSVNRMFEAVALFGPSLYHQNPTIAVSARPPLGVSIESFFAHDPQAMQLLQMIPAMQEGLVADDNVMQLALSLQEQYDTQVTQTQTQVTVNNDIARILEAISNYIQQEGGKQDEARLAITEAIVTGLGLLELEWYQPPGGGPRMPQCRFLSNRDFFVDPDATYWRDVTFIIIRRVAPKNIVEDRFGLEPGSIKGKHVSNTALTGNNPREMNRDGQGNISGRAHDLVEYFDIYSKNGAGQRLKIGDKDRKIEGLDQLGDFVYLAISPTCNYPLNLPPSVPIIDPVTGDVSEEALQRTAWPAPFWDDAATDGGWPVARLSFYQNPGHTWPLSMCKPVLPQIRFINWCMSFLADGVAAGSKIYPAVIKSAAENIRQQIAEGNGPFTVIELEQITGKKIDDLISFLKAPEFNIDIWKMIAEVNEQIDKGLGLTELLYGLSSRQMRSAAEAQYRQSNVNIRPDDMASRVEDWLSVTATREIQLLRWNGTYEDVVGIVGPMAAHVFTTQLLTRDVSSVTREFTFRVAAGTARKPNKDTRITQLNEIGQYLLPVTQQAMQLGVPRPFNAFIEDYGKAIDMDASRYMITPEETNHLMQLQLMQVAPPPTQGASDGANQEAA